MEILVNREEVGLKRALGVSDLIIYGMVYMLPIAPFALFGIIGNVSNGQVPLVYFFSLIAMLFTARSYMVLSAEFPTAGSAYTYTQKGIGEFAGFLAGWVVFLDYIIAPGLLSVVSAAAMNNLIVEIPRWVWIVVFVGTGTVLNLVGVNITAKYNKLFLYFMLFILLIYVGVCIEALYGGKGNGELTFSSLFSVKVFSWAGIATGVLIGSTNFLGFDAITTLGEEVKHDQKHLLGFAGIATLLIIGLLFIIQTWVTADLAPGAEIHSPDTALYDIAYYAGGNWLFWLTSISTAFAFGIPCTIVCQSAIARIIFAMGRDRQLPHIFARLHPRSQQPYVANIFVAVVSLVVSLAFQNHIDEIALFQNFGALTAFSLVNASLIGYFWFKKGSRDLLRHMILPLIGLGIILALLFAMRVETLQLGAIWVVCGLVYYFIMRVVLGRRVVLDS
jgi:amino acid transporter